MERTREKTMTATIKTSSRHQRTVGRLACHTTCSQCQALQQVTASIVIKISLNSLLLEYIHKFTVIFLGKTNEKISP